MVRPFIRADTAALDPRIRKVLPCWMVRGRSAACAQAAHTNNVDNQRTLTRYPGGLRLCAAEEHGPIALRFLGCELRPPTPVLRAEFE